MKLAAKSGFMVWVCQSWSGRNQCLTPDGKIEEWKSTVLTELLFGFGIGLSLAFVATGFRYVLKSFSTIADAG